MDNELCHYGILGMRWGVRRYQSYDEAPTKSGKRGKEIGDARDSGSNDRRSYASNSASSKKRNRNSKWNGSRKSFKKRINKTVLHANIRDCRKSNTVSRGREISDIALSDAGSFVIKLSALVAAGIIISKTPLGQELTGAAGETVKLATNLAKTANRGLEGINTGATKIASKMHHSDSFEDGLYAYLGMED